MIDQDTRQKIRARSREACLRSFVLNATIMCGCLAANSVLVPGWWGVATAVGSLALGCAARWMQSAFHREMEAIRDGPPSLYESYLMTPMRESRPQRIVDEYAKILGMNPAPKATFRERKGRAGDYNFFSHEITV